MRAQGNPDISEPRLVVFDYGIPVGQTLLGAEYIPRAGVAILKGGSPAILAEDIDGPKDRLVFLKR